MNILVTGGAGFVGSNLAIKLKAKNPSFQVIAFDNLKRRGSEINLQKLKDFEIDFIHGDIRNPEDLEFKDSINLIIDASAEPSVMAGLKSSPLPVISNNLIGTINLLEVTRKHGSKLIFISTSRVYGIDALNKINLNENDTRFFLDSQQELNGISNHGINEFFSTGEFRSFYGGTKLASEILIQEYIKYCGLEAIINRCGVIAGPGQMGKIDQGIAVLWMARHFWKGKLKYIGYGGHGKQVRDILHVDDLYRLIQKQIDNFSAFHSKTFNVGGGISCSISLQELTNLCSLVTGNKIHIDKDPNTRDADIRYYVTDNSKISSISNWNPQYTVKDILSDILEWIRVNETQLKPILTL
ncbi:MAG: NAD-dependent epimerase/dehydratase family protein [Cyclobacteriaceae bacterium]